VLVFFRVSLYLREMLHMPPKKAKDDLAECLKKIKDLDLRVKKLESGQKGKKAPIMDGDAVTIRRTCH
jgi:hypothetical protein